MSGGSRGLGVSGPPSSACAGVAGLASLSQMPAAFDPQVFSPRERVGWTCGFHWDMWPQILMVAVLDPHFLRRFHDKCSYTDTHILSLRLSLTAKLYFMFVYLPLLCLSGVVYRLSVLCYRCSSWRPSTSVCFILTFPPTPIVSSLISVPFFFYSSMFFSRLDAFPQI